METGSRREGDGMRDPEDDERDEPEIEWPEPRENPEHEPHEPWTRFGDADRERDDE